MWIDFDRLHDEIRAAFPALVLWREGVAEIRYTLDAAGQVALPADLSAAQSEVAAVVAAHNPDVLELTSDSVTIQAGDVEHATIGVRLHDRDGNTRLENRTVTVAVDGEAVDVPLTDGAGAFTLGSLYAGTVRVSPRSPVLGNVLSIEVTP